MFEHSDVRFYRHTDPGRPQHARLLHRFFMLETDDAPRTGISEQTIVVQRATFLKDFWFLPRSVSQGILTGKILDRRIEHQIDDRDTRPCGAKREESGESVLKVAFPLFRSSEEKVRHAMKHRS